MLNSSLEWLIPHFFLYLEICAFIDTIYFEFQSIFNNFWKLENAFPFDFSGFFFFFFFHRRQNPCSGIKNYGSISPRRKKMFAHDILRWHRLPFFAHFEFAGEAIVIRSHVLLIFFVFFYFLWYNRVYTIESI